MPRKAGAEVSCNGKAEVEEAMGWWDIAGKWPGREEVAKEDCDIS